jgi:hypothetical protein
VERLRCQATPLIAIVAIEVVGVQPTQALTLFPQEDVGFLGERVVTDLDIHGKIRAHVKGRVDVDQLETALLFNLLPQRAVLQR